MTYVYAAMWFAVGFILIFRMSRENRVFYAAGAFFFLLGGWWLADALFPAAKLFAGVWGWVLRGITVLALLLMCAVFYQETKKEKNKDGGEEPPNDKE